MTFFTVDTDAVFSATSALRSTAERLRSETATMMAQLSDLPSSWSGQASAAFQSAAEQWRSAQTHVEQALDSAGRQYAQAEDYSASLFR